MRRCAWRMVLGLGGYSFMLPLYLSGTREGTNGQSLPEFLVLWTIVFVYSLVRFALHRARLRSAVSELLHFRRERV